MAIEITRDTMRAALILAVAKRGADYVYDKTIPGWSRFDEGMVCVYSTPDGSPACLFGEALSILGYDITGIGVTGIGAILRDLGVEDSALRLACESAQTAQDLERTWGEALTQFDEFLAC